MFGIIPEPLLRGGEFLANYYLAFVLLGLLVFFLSTIWIGYQIGSWRIRKSYDFERYKLELSQKAELEKHRMWEESNRPLLQDSADKGAIRNTKFAMCMAIIEAFQKSVNDNALSQKERELWQKATKRVKDMQDAIMQIW